jgi:hypothetical protein
MRYICNSCGEVVQSNDITIHHTTGDKGLEIVAICQSCLENYLQKSKIDADKKDEDTERMKMKRKW